MGVKPSRWSLVEVCTSNIEEDFLSPVLRNQHIFRFVGADDDHLRLHKQRSANEGYRPSKLFFGSERYHLLKTQGALEVLGSCCLPSVTLVYRGVSRDSSFSGRAVDDWFVGSSYVWLLVEQSTLMRLCEVGHKKNGLGDKAA